MHTTQTAAAGRPVARRRRKSPSPVGLRGGASIVVTTPSKRGMGAMLCAWAVVVLEAAVPRYACCGWGGPSNGHGREKGPERTTRSGRHTTTLPFEGTPGGVEKVSSEEYVMAASSLVRWSGSAALLGGLSAVFVDEVMPFHRSKSKGE